MTAGWDLDSARATLAEFRAVATKAYYQGGAVQIDVADESSVPILFVETPAAFGRIATTSAALA